MAEEEDEREEELSTGNVLIDVEDGEDGNEEEEDVDTGALEEGEVVETGGSLVNVPDDAAEDFSVVEGAKVEGEDPEDACREVEEAELAGASDEVVGFETPEVVS